MKKPVTKKKEAAGDLHADYSLLVGGIGELLEAARRSSVRAVNAFMTATYWEVGRRIVEFEQGGKKRAGYGDELLKRLSVDLTSLHGRGFSVQNLENMRLLYGVCGMKQISQTLSGKSVPDSVGISAEASISQTSSGISQVLAESIPTLPPHLSNVARAFPLPWSHYVLLVRRSHSPDASPSTIPRPSAEDGPCVSYSGRSIVSFTSVQHSPETKQRC